MVQQAELTLEHEPGLHIRAAMLLVSAAQQYDSKITVTYKEVVADAKSIYALVGLCVLPGSLLTVRAEGEDEEAACQARVKLILSGFVENADGD